MMSITGGEVGFFESPAGQSRLRLFVQTAPSHDARKGRRRNLPESELLPYN
jgi:hypothetical protein